MRVGLVGTGEMGRLLVDRLAAAGHDVVVFARRTEVRRELRSAGVECAAGLGKLGERCDAVLLYVYSDDQVREIVFADGLGLAMRAGTTLVVLTTGSPATMAEIERALNARGVAVLDAPGSGGPEDLRAGKLSLFVGGSRPDVERCRPLFATFANTVSHVGPVGAGQAVKLVNNLLFGAHVQVAIEASELCRSLGLDPAHVAETLHSCSGSSYALDLIATMGSAEALLERAAPYIHKDVVVAAGVARDIGASLESLDPIISAVLGRTVGRSST